jgi:hypothetical protein
LCFLGVLFIGIDTWIRLYARMVVILPKFNRTNEACQKKFEKIFKAYKDNKMANGISGNDCHERKFYDAMDEWWHQTGQMMKHVSITTTNNMDFHNTSSPKMDSLPDSTSTPSSTSKSEGKQKNSDRAIDIFEKMAEIGTSLMKDFERTNALLERIDSQFDCLINKL